MVIGATNTPDILTAAMRRRFVEVEFDAPSAVERCHLLHTFLGKNRQVVPRCVTLLDVTETINPHCEMCGHTVATIPFHWQ